VVAPRPERFNNPPPAESKDSSQAVQKKTVDPVAEKPVEAPPVSDPGRSKEFKLPPYIVPPDAATVPPNGGQGTGMTLRMKKKADNPRMVTVILHPCGDKVRDQRRLQRLHGLLRSCPGLDRFSLMIHEGGKDYLVEFPNSTTGISTEMLRKLSAIIGEDNVRVTPVKG
jgi:hypothetical protein